MKKENFERLLESVKEASQISRGEIEPAREVWIEIPKTLCRETGFALCIKTDDPKLLVPAKIYQAKFSSTGHVGVIDEEGEAAVYPSDFFIQVEFPAEVANVLAGLQAEPA